MEKRKLCQSWGKKNQLQKAKAVVQAMLNTLCDSNPF